MKIFWLFGDLNDFLSRSFNLFYCLVAFYSFLFSAGTGSNELGPWLKGTDAHARTSLNQSRKFHALDSTIFKARFWSELTNYWSSNPCLHSSFSAVAFLALKLIIKCSWLCWIQTQLLHLLATCLSGLQTQIFLSLSSTRWVRSALVPALSTNYSKQCRAEQSKNLIKIKIINFWKKGIFGNIKNWTWGH